MIALYGIQRSVLCTALIVVSQTSFALQRLTDTEMSASTGQSLLTTAYVAPSGASGSVTDFGFYKIGLQATVDINANIKKLQLGCGGANGANGCDIDIDNLTLSGTPTGAQVRADTSARMTNPFVQFAIKNPTSASTRELVGMRFGSEAMTGLLQMGSQTSSSTDATAGNGLNTLSGYMKTVPGSGTSTTASGYFDETSRGQMHGVLCPFGAAPNCFLGIPISGPFTNTVSSSNQTAAPDHIFIPSLNVSFQVPALTVSGTRLTAVPTQVISTVLPNIPLAGTLPNVTSVSLGFITTNNPVVLDGTIKNANLNIQLDEGLSYIHSIPLAGNGVSLSLQKQQVFWPGGSVAANRGWWMDTTGTVTLGSMSTATPINSADLYPTINTLVNQNFTDHPLDIGNVDASVLFGVTLRPPAFTVDLAPYTDGTAGHPALLKPVQNVKLSAQDTAANCYGARTFC